MNARNGVLLAMLAAACSSPVDEQTPPPGSADLADSTFVVSTSGTVAGGVFSAASAVRRTADPVVFVSLPTGTLLNGRATRIEVQRTHQVVEGTVVGGGLDPLAVPALPGDLLTVTVSGAGGTVTSFSYGVPLHRPPTIIRTTPDRNKRDVPLNLRLKVVVSTPLDEATLHGLNVELRSAGGPVGGQIAFINTERTAFEFVPGVSLSPSTAYELVIHTGLRGADGTALEAEQRIPFTTAAGAEPVTQLAFVRDGQIFLVNSDGTGLLQLTHTVGDATNADPAWSPDGRRLAFASNRDGDWDIYVMNADGSNVVRRTSGGYNVEPTWSPYGRTIAFTSVRDGSAGVWMIDADSGDEIRVLLDRPGWDAYPAWVPTGLQLTFTSDWRAYDILYDLYIVNADGTNVRPLLEGPFFWVDGQTFYFQSAWSPDAQRFAVVLCEYAWDNCYPSSSIAVADPDGTNLRIVARAGGYSRPAWSRDGRTIAFSSAECRECETTLRFVRLDGSDEGVLSPNGHSPAWRP